MDVPETCLQIPIVIFLLLPFLAHEFICGERSFPVVDHLYDTRCYQLLNALYPAIKSRAYLLIIFRTISEQKTLGCSLARYLPYPLLLL